jgi:autotransporter-associated beta strand protein
MNGSFTFAGSNDLTFGTGAVTAGSSRTVTLQGTGRTLTFGGDLKFSNVGANTTLTVNGAGNTVVFNGFQINPANQSRNQVLTGDANITFNGGLYDGAGPSSSDSLTYSGTGTLTLGGVSNITSPTTFTVGGGTVLINNADALKGGWLARGSGTLQFGTGIGTFNVRGLSGGTSGIILEDMGGNPIALSLNATGSGSTGTTTKTYSQVLSGSGSIIKTGTQVQILSGANTYTGGTTVTGTLRIGSNGVAASGVRSTGPVGTGTLTLADGALLTTSGGTGRSIQNDLILSGSIVLGAATTDTGSLTFNSSGLDTAATVTLVGNTTLSTLTSTTISNVISGGFGLTKTGASTLTLGAANTFTGPTAINAGTLTLTSTGSLASTAISIANGATFNVSALSSYSLASINLTIATNGVTGGLLNAGSIAMTLGGNLTIDFTGSPVDGSVDLYTSGTPTGDFNSVTLIGDVAGSLSLAAQTWTGSFSGYNFQFDQSTGVLTFAAIPEPSTYALAVMGLLAVTVMVRRRRQVSA